MSGVRCPRRARCSLQALDSHELLEDELGWVIYRLQLSSGVFLVEIWSILDGSTVFLDSRVAWFWITDYIPYTLRLLYIRQVIFLLPFNSISELANARPLHAQEIRRTLLQM